MIWTQRIINPNYDDSDGGDKSTLGKWTVKSFKCVMAKGLLFSAILTFTVPPEMKELLIIPILGSRLLLDHNIR